MGAFVLYRRSLDFADQAVRTVLAKKGFAPPEAFELGDHRLLLCRKQLVQQQNWVAVDDGDALFVHGTPIYRGRGYEDSLRNLLRDFRGPGIVQGELDGLYCLIFWVDGRLTLIVDSSDLVHLFANEDCTLVTSSLQLTLVAENRPRRLNRIALVEQLVTGTVVGSETLFDGLYLLDRERQRAIRPAHLALGQNEPPHPCPAAVCRGSFEDAIDAQLEYLRGYFRRIGTLMCEQGVTLGLSGGFDSRLLLALVREVGARIEAHTYQSDAHGREVEIARELAHLAGVPLRTIPVKICDAKPEHELVNNLEDALYFFDGRTNMTMGSFNDVHTRAIRSAAIGHNGLSLNGLGGELYRNREHLRPGRLDFRQWFQYYVLDPSTASVLLASRRGGVLEYLIAKYEKILDGTRAFDRGTARRYYREVWLPYSAGVKHAAESQLCHHLLPFAESTVSSLALEATPHVGIAGWFEAVMIQRVAPVLGRVSSSYGYPFSRMPPSIRARAWLEALVPLRVRNIIGRTRARARTKQPLSRESSATWCGVDAMRRLDLPIDIMPLLRDCVHRDRVHYVGYFLHSFREHIT